MSDGYGKSGVDFRPTRIRMLRADTAKELVLILNEIKDTLGTHIK